VSYCKEIEWRITLIGDYEKASKHRLCKNEQRAKKGRFWRTGCRLVARDGVRWMNGAIAADFAWHGPTTGSCRRPRVERLSTATRQLWHLAPGDRALQRARRSHSLLRMRLQLSACFRRMASRQSRPVDIVFDNAPAFTKLPPN
jgi:hypothetical protein